MTPAIHRLGGLARRATTSGEELTRPMRLAADRTIRGRASTIGLDPILDATEIEARQQAARRAHFIRAGIASGRARRAQRAAREAAIQTL